MDRVGPYRIVGEVARGGMGVVLRALDPAGQAVALKLLQRNDDPNARRRFQVEVASLSRLRHPNLVPILGAGEHDGHPWLALEFVEGESLEARLRRGPLGIDEAVLVARQLTQALSYVHACGVLHRDLKPANVLLRRGQALLTDFGLALDVDASTSRLTLSGAFLGTPGYWAPEQAQGQTGRIGPVTDVYGLGAVLYACLTGRPPVQGASLQEFLQASQDRPIVPPRRVRPEVPTWLSQLCMECLASAPEARPGTADQVARALATAGAFASPMRSRRVSRTGLASVLIFGALGTVGGALWFVVQGDPAPEPIEPLPPVARKPESVVPEPLGPAWYLALPPALRRPLPLPEGVVFGADSGDYVNEKDGTLLRWIPPGSFLMGVREDDPEAASDERPQRRVSFARGYFLAKHETCWAQFRAFCKATGHPLRSNRIALTQLGGETFVATATHPVGGVTWDEAVAYCRWAGLRLPSEAEWEFAARGTDGRRYPWGDEAPDATRANLADRSATWDWPEELKAGAGYAKASFDDGSPCSAPVGSYPSGASPFGCLDLAGNVEEWVQDHAGSYGDAPVDGSPAERDDPSLERVARGGSWLYDARDCRTTKRRKNAASASFADQGFRPARSP